MMRIATVLGARPQFIKAAPVSRALAAVNGGNPLHEVLIHTGQHYDDQMSQVFFHQLGLPDPNYNLGVGSGSHGQQTGAMLAAIEAVLLQERPDYVLVYGDTNSTLAGALAAAKLHIPLAHVEAGLRSFNRRMPEEINRIMADHVSDMLFVPTETAVANLQREGITNNVFLVGDVMQDAVADHAALAAEQSKILEILSIRPKHFLLATIHRAENTDSPARLGRILAALAALAQEHVIVWPVHPRARKCLHESAFPSNLRLIEPAAYFDMLVLERNAAVILTDSGGVQKEARWLQVPCVTLRDETEWVETLRDGWNQLAGSDIELILGAVERARLRHADHPVQLVRSGAAARIAECLAQGARVVQREQE